MFYSHQPNHDGAHFRSPFLCLNILLLIIKYLEQKINLEFLTRKFSFTLLKLIEQ